MDERRVVTDRFFDLAVARALQLQRAVDVNTVRRFIGASNKANSRLGGRFSTYKNAGAVAGEIFGRDESGYPFKRWRLVAPDAAKELLRRQKIRPFPRDVMDGWRGGTA